MATFVISYDLHNVRNYEPLISRLAEAGAVRLLQSMWLYEEATSAEQVRNALMQLTDQDDAIAVLELRPGSDWATVRVPELAVTFLKSKVRA